MEELTKALNEVIGKDESGDAAERDTAVVDLDTAGQRWAVHCLRTYTGSTLTAGLAISRAIATFSTRFNEDMQ